MYRYVFFDLDGTITDPGMGITNSVMYALDKYNIKVENRSELYPFIGPPLHESFQKYFSFSEEESFRAVEYYREYYRTDGIYENRVYDGVEEMLKALKEQGRTIVLATSKPEQFAIEILEHFHLMQYFDVVAGATMDAARVDKSDVIAYAIRQGNISDKKSTIMVGDREYDILGAKANGMSSIGVLYGYGSEEELKKAGATHLAASPIELLSYL